MMSVLSIDQVEEELTDVRGQNQRLIREVGNVQRENFHLRRQIRQDRQWLAEALRIIHEAQENSVDKPLVSCSCGLEAVLQRAHKRALEVERTFDEKNQ